MNTNEHDNVHARKWQLDLDEVAGRSAPPERVDDILRRVAMVDEEDLPRPTSSRLWPAALVLLGIAATVGVSTLGHQDPEVVPGMAQDKQTGQQDEAKQKLQRENKTLKQRIVDLEKAVALNQAKQNPLAQIAALQRGVVATDRGLAKLAVPKIQAIDRASRQAFFGFMMSDLNHPNPLRRGDFLIALTNLTAKRKKLDQATDAAKARKIIDEMSQVLNDARRALWEMEQAAKRAKKPAKKNDK